MSTPTTFTPEQVLATPAGTLAQQPAELLFSFKNSADDLLTDAKSLCDHIDQAIDFKWNERARFLRHEVDKDTGVVHFDDGNVRITADLPKKIEWDQTRLAEIARRISESGDDPKQYVEITFRVSETKFNAWPDTLKSSFNAARTVKTGKPSYRLALIKE
ncbi:MAG: hypothetical protein EWV88_21805 [Microcystis wesenbergii Mw_MB_S_20031200_S109D]|jgi:hypothetical protein|uniref:Uncharacterized protein n=1 Tax=Microcystis wesenbergii Mw_MB_S_20031200_S109D TaxID=2486241 RepID=A0A552LC89_9CHRO|nr:hypothetical protein [Polynucleobacter sp.]TRV17815.1 MAG: hypothetical protein EWV88_21805 [Microcystis wesenbergii Mw_MB_S_20031200_S109D]